MNLRPTGYRLWKKHVEIYTEVFRRALVELSKLPAINGNEIAISIQLNELLQQTCFEIDEELVFPKYNLPIPPTVKGKYNMSSKTGQPDFTCCLKNPHAQSHRESELNFHIECKCLGTPQSPTWNFNKNYVEHGIMRFDQENKRYGEHVTDGMMIGYILSMCPEDICKEVNVELTKIKYSPISFPNSHERLQETTQRLTRKIINPADFTLIHIWVVLN